MVDMNTKGWVYTYLQMVVATSERVGWKNYSNLHYSIYNVKYIIDVRTQKLHQRSASQSVSQGCHRSLVLIDCENNKAVPDCV